jgi:hypothetical protein
MVINARSKEEREGSDMTEKVKTEVVLAYMEDVVGFIEHDIFKISWRTLPEFSSGCDPDTTS